MAMTVRARYPDGQTLSLDSLAPTACLGDLQARVQAHKGWTAEPRLLLAGRPPVALTAGPLTLLRDVLPVGGCAVIVEPHPNDKPGSSATATSRATAKGKGRGRGRGRGSMSGGGSNIRSLNDVSKAKGAKRTRVTGTSMDYDDERDVDWADTVGDLADEEDEDDGTEDRRTRRKLINPTGQPSNSKPTSSSATVQPVQGVSAAAKAAFVSADTRCDVSGVASEVGILGGREVLSVQLAASVFDESGSRFDNAVTRELRANLGNALKRRQAEADGERRYAAYLSGRYCIETDGALKFKVRYAGLRQRWKVDNRGPFTTWPRPLLKAVVQLVVKETNDRLKLYPMTMAAVSPRMFWNIVRLFPDGSFEQGLRSLAPDADWSFLVTRQRTLSAKAKENLENRRNGYDVDV